ncbi:TetR/AcrR family transcriptional regulator [Thalassorhabdus alkalitolerans]|uniref:TetR/AcrR family transcriptional regulator n=1 Tax=Thalassorhabdus alkalitolerans TaxID=2282697 RepID=A0ABW0YJ28_9BACI
MLQNKREMIVKAAASSFSMFGYKKTTIDQVAKLANIGKGTVYTSFESKESLFEAVLEQILQEIQHVFDNSIDPEKEVEENISVALYEILTFRKQHQLLLKLSQEVSTIGSANAKQALEKVEEFIIECIQRLLETAKNNGKINVDDPHITAFVIYKLYMAVTVEYSEIYEPLGKDEIVRFFNKHLTRGILSKNRSQSLSSKQ